MVLSRKKDFYFHNFLYKILRPNGYVENSNAPVVFDSMVAGFLHQSPMWIKARGCPWHLKMPQKTIGTKSCP